MKILLILVPKTFMMKQLLFIGVLLINGLNAYAQNTGKGRIVVSADGHDLQYEDGSPFFWLGDTGWELFHRLSLPEIKEYLDNRAAKGFTVIQAVALAEFDGLHTPNRYGEKPLVNDDPAKPNEAYFRLVDSTLKMAAERGLFIGLLPTWGDKVTLAWGTGPVVFDSINAYTYGKWLGNRYKDKPNIIWILGGDRPAMQDQQDWRAVWRQMARGIREATSGNCLIAYHPSGGNISTSSWFQKEDWLDVNMFQSGHGSGHDVPNWETVKKDRDLLPAKPTLDAEPNYEDHPVNPWPKWNPDNGYFRDYDVRKQAYRSVFAGACGITYGHHAIWQFMSGREEIINYADRGWQNALDRQGAFQVGYLRNLMESRPFLNRMPDSMLVVGGLGKGSEHIEAFWGDNNHYAMIYLPVGKIFKANTSFIKAKKIKAWWFDPKTGKAMQIGTFKPSDKMIFTTPTPGIGNDWVLVIDDAEKAYGMPGA